MRGLVYSFQAAEAIPAYRAVTYNNGVDGIVVAGGTTNETITLLGGVSTDIAGVTGATVDVVVQGFGEIQLGGTVKLFDTLMADSTGKAVRWTSGNLILGTAMGSGASGDIIPVLVNATR